jgi:hypothetical protein
VMSMKSIVRVSLASVALLGLAGPGPGRAVAAAPPAAAPSESPSASPTPAPGKDPLLEFVPKDHVPADSAVSFPVDI